MSESRHASGSPGVALLFEDASLSAHLREALVEAGARIVHEGPATAATREDLAGNGAEVVVVNLDDKVEEHLDALYEIFDEDSQRIVFNDAEASSGLSGWDQARWARHLAAKLLNARDVDPPRPAEARAIEAHPTELLLPDEDMPEAPPVEPGQAADEQATQDDSAEQSEALTAELEALLAEDGDLLGRVEDDDPATLASMEIELDEEDVGEAESAAVDVIPDAGAPVSPEPESPGSAPEPVPADTPPEPSGDASPAAGEGDDSAFEATLRMFDQALAESEQDADAVEREQATAERLFQAPAEEDVAEGAADAQATPPAAEPEPESEPVAGPESEPEQAVTAPAADAGAGEPAASPTPSSIALVDPGDDSPLDIAGAERQTVEPPKAPDWDLVDFDQPSEAGGGVEIIDQGSSQQETSDPSEFGIEKMTASDYLSPEADDAPAAADIEPTFSLELEPMEKAVAPQMVEPTISEMSLDTDSVGSVRRAVVLAAGSSDEARGSLEDFVRAIDRVPAAVILAVVHQRMGDDLKALAATLNEISPIMPVRVARDVPAARQGEMLLVPAGKQAALDPGGRLQLMDATEQPMANPSIDLTMTLVAQEIGSRSLAIVLAGDAIDALAGAQAVTDAGGIVWAMDPSDCNDNTMVSVICEEQLATQTGSAKELAARMLEELS